MKKIASYVLEGELKTDNSGFSKWGFAKKGKKRYFIKEFLSPVYPYYIDMLTPDMVESKKKMCQEYEQRNRLLYETINKSGDGNLVRIEEFFRYNSKYYITTEVVDNVPVAFVKNRGIEERIRICRVLLHCVGTLHQNGIVHGDIKMDNILFKLLPSGCVTAKVIDFDNCFWEKMPPAATEEVHGDMLYMAPETYRMMATEQGTITSAIDVFALGLVFHELLSGDLPKYDHERYHYPFEVILNEGNMRCDNHLSVCWKTMIARMLEKNPEKRITLAEAMAMFEKQSEAKLIVPETYKTEQPKDAEKQETIPAQGFFQQAGDL